MKKINLILLMMLLMSCQNRIYTACPNIIEYSKEFNNQLAKDLEKEESYYIKQSIIDYYNLREKIKICNK